MVPWIASQDGPLDRRGLRSVRHHPRRAARRPERRVPRRPLPVHAREPHRGRRRRRPRVDQLHQLLRASAAPVSRRGPGAARRRAGLRVPTRPRPRRPARPRRGEGRRACSASTSTTTSAWSLADDETEHLAAIDEAIADRPGRAHRLLQPCPQRVDRARHRAAAPLRHRRRLVPRRLLSVVRRPSRVPARPHHRRIDERTDRDASIGPALARRRRRSSRDAEPCPRVTLELPPDGALGRRAVPRRTASIALRRRRRRVTLAVSARTVARTPAPAPRARRRSSSTAPATWPTPRRTAARRLLLATPTDATAAGRITGAACTLARL